MKRTLLKKSSILIAISTILLTGCSEFLQKTGMIEENISFNNEVTMEKIYAAQDREAILDYHGNIWYDFSIYKGNERTDYTYFCINDYIYYASANHFQLYQNDNYLLYAQDENAYYASILNTAFDIAEYDNLLFQKEKECANSPQTIIETSVNADNLKVVTQYHNHEVARELVENLGFAYEENYILQSTYVMNIKSLVIYACEDRLIFCDGTEEVIRKYNVFYESTENNYPEKFVELKERMKTTENITKYTIVTICDENEVSTELNIVKGDELRLDIDKEHYVVAYDKEGLNPLNNTIIQSTENNITLYIIEN